MGRIRKYYHSHSFGAFLTGFALLALVAVFAVFFILPVFSVTKGSETLNISGFDFLSIGMGRFIKMAFPSFPDTKDISLFTNYLDSYGGGNVLLEAIAKYYDFAFIAISGLFAVCIPFVAIEAILAIFWILRGRIQFPRASSVIAWVIFAFFGLSIGLAFAFVYFSQQILDAAGDGVSLTFLYLPFFILGAIFGLSLLVSIIHIIGYRDRRYKKREKKFDDDEDNNNNNNNSNNNNNKNRNYDQEEPEPEMVQEKGLPEGIVEIGDHAFSKDSSLTSADIPEGITVLGPAAFANCHNLRSVSIPLSVTEIGYNCFFNTGRLTKITYAGTREDWAKIIRGSNWLTNAATVNVHTADGVISVNPKN